MDKRDHTLREVLLEKRDEPFASLDELVEHCHRALSAHLWTTCRWSQDGAGWKVGDFNYLVVSVAPDADSSLYVQFWSEPREGVLTEVGSGEWCPGAVRYIGPAQRKALDARGYTRGGRAQNYQKEVDVDSAAAAEGAALEVLQIFFDVFGYRGQYQLDVERHRGERADRDLVYTAVTSHDFAKVASRAGFDATVTNRDDTPIVALTRGRRAFLALMDGPLPRQHLFSLIAFQAELRLKWLVTDEAIAQVNSTMQFVKIWRTGRYTVRMHMAIALDGGVTAAWLAQSLHNWMSSWRACERQLRRGLVPAKRRRASSAGAELVQ